MALTWTAGAQAARAAMDTAGAMLTDEQAATAAELYQPWSGDGVEYAVGDRRRYEGELYRCLTAHTSQAAWTPTDAPSLWVRIDDPAIEWPEWRQPTGATDAYPMGAKVSHNGKHWVSNVDANVWEPGVYGWDEVTAGEGA